MATTSVRMQQRRDTTANWASNNPILGEGEVGFNTTTDQIKIGDGTTHWADLPYINISTSDIVAAVAGALTDPGSAHDALLAVIDTEVPAASTSTPGKAELATNAETLTGTDPARTVTPAGLKSVVDPIRNLTDATLAASLSASILATAMGLLDNASTSADGAIAVQTLTKVDASGATRAMTIPDGTLKGQLAVAEKTDASANLVNVTGKIRSTGSTTFPLTYQYETILFVWGGTYWEPLAGHRTKTSIDTQIDGRAVTAQSTASAGSRNIVGSPSTQVGAGSDAITVFGGSTALPHILDPGSSLTTIPGGYDNQNRTWPGAGAAAIMSVINGAHHLVDSLNGHGTISGGSYGAQHGDYGVIGGGTLDVCAGSYGVIGGGRNNCAGATSKATVATTAVTVGATSLTIGTVTGKALVTGVTLFIDNGNKSETFTNVTVSGSTITLASGSFAKAHAIGTVCYFTDGTATDATVGGGQSNNAIGLQATVAGGFNGLARGTGATVGGGVSNIAGSSANANATVAGGTQNVASGAGSTIGGGVSGLANAANATVGGGNTNTASGTGSGVPYGDTNTASGNYAGAAGNRAVADHYGERALASGNFTAVGDAQISDLVARAVLTGAGSAEEFLDQVSARVLLADNTAYEFRIRTIAYARASSGTAPNTIVGRWVTEGAIYRKTGAATTAMFSSTTTADAATVSGFTFAASADTTNGSLKLLATCIASYSTFWVSRVELVKVSG